MTDEQVEKRAEELYRKVFGDLGNFPWPPSRNPGIAEVWRDAARAEIEKENQ